MKLKTQNSGSLKRYDLIVPENFSLGLEIGITIAATIDKALDENIRHFSAKIPYEELFTVKDILQTFENDGIVAVWDEEKMGKNQLGIMVREKSEDNKMEVKSYLVNMHPGIAEKLFPKESERSGDTEPQETEEKDEISI